MTKSEISELKEKAQKAKAAIESRTKHDWVERGKDRLAFYNLATPQAILALIEMNEKMREALEFYKGNFDGKEGSYWLDGYKFIQEDKFGDTKYFDNGDRARQTIALFDGEVKA